MPEITFVRADTGQARAVDKAQITIGSSSDCDIQLKHPSVWAQHATVRVRHGEVSIIGADPELSLDVNGMPVIGARTLEAGASLRIGDVRLEVR